MATKANNLDIVKNLIKQGAYFDIENNKNQKPLDLTTNGKEVYIFLSKINELFEAAKDGRSSDVSTLITQGAYINARNEDGDTPLHLAAQAGKKEVVQNLITQGAYYNIGNKQGNTPLGLSTAHTEVQNFLSNINQLFTAAQTGESNTVNTLITRGAYINARNEDGDTPLHLAAQTGESNTVNTLITRGAYINARNEDGDTPLHLAAENGHEEITTTLLAQSGVNVNEPDKDGKTPLHLAAENNKKNILDKLLEVPGINVNAFDTLGNTALHLAVENNNGDIVTALLAKPGININAEDKDRATPLYIAASKGNLEVVKKLIEQGAYFDVETSSGNTPLLPFSSQEPYLDVYEFLDKISKLLNAAREGTSVNAVNDLIEQGAYINARNKDGNTALHLAAKNGYKEIVDTLLTKPKINVNAKNKDGDTPLCLASKNDKKNAVEALLKDPKIDVDVRDEDGKTASDLTNDKEIKTLLRNKRNAQDSGDDTNRQENNDNKDESQIKPIASTQTEEQTSGFFESLSDIIIQPISLVVLAIGSFFAWLFWSNTGKTEEHTNQPSHSLVELNSHDYDDQNDLHLF